MSKDKSPGARSSLTYTEDAVVEILSRLTGADGEPESLRAICQDEHLPSKGTFLRWVVQDREGLADRYARAREIQAHIWVEETLEIADDQSNDWTVDEDGTTRANRESVQRSRLRVDTRKWHISKILSNLYGDSINVRGSDGRGPVEVTVKHEVIDPRSDLEDGDSSEEEVPGGSED